ncbi:MAG TPA: hypothetical protein VK706_07415, partial [Candidatus Sulfotelmatobacter sp.]|nr:hypothetical protein [Candidatus Sulfotelmatobacter sp.]
MRAALAILLVSGMAWAQTADTAKPAPAQPATSSPSLSSDTSRPAKDLNATVIPAGSKIPLTLKQAISTKNAREGDAVYAETAFPFVLNERILIPAGTYIQGKIMHTEHPGHS